MKNNKTVSERCLYFDNIKGILIFLVVYTHCMYESQFNTAVNYIVDFVYMFHMPAFVFVTGYLSKSERSRSVRSLVKLAVCFVIFNAVMYFGFYRNNPSAVTPYNSMWYIMAVIVWRILAKHLAKIKHIILILAFAAFAAGMWQDIDNTLALSRVICFSPFFMAGYLFDKDKMNFVIKKRTPKMWLTGVLLFVCTLCIGLAALKYLDYSDNQLTWFAYTSGNDIVERVVLMITAVLGTAAIVLLTPDKKLPFLNQIGRNSLSVYLLHRPLTLIYSDFFGYSEETVQIAGLSFAAAMLIVLLLGSDFCADIVNKVTDRVTDIILDKNRKKSVCAVMAAAVALCAVSPIFFKSELRYFAPMKNNMETETAITEIPAANTDIIHRIMPENTAEQYENAFRIAFTGDMILLEDQVKRGYKGSGEYDFSDVFEYTTDYISSADIAIGVFEGPMGGAEAGYSTSNFSDNKELYLNFPDEFANAVKDAGYDLVTTANNHLLDKGVNAAMRTLDVLDEIGLEHTGSYRSSIEKEAEKIALLEKNGIKFAVLSYTYGSNYYTEEEFVNGELSYITSVLAPPSSENFDAVKEQVRLDFEKAKAENPDFIIVLPHMGTQFANEPDNYQLTWCSVFKEFGADIILGDHTHSIQPAELTYENGKKVFTAYCPGNYTNIYREHNGDAAAIVEVYIDRNSKEIIGGGIVPMWIYSTLNENYRPVPIYDILNNDSIRSSLSTDDFERVQEIFSHITEVMTGSKLTVDLADDRIYFDSEGYFRKRSEKMALTAEMEQSSFFKAVTSAESVCFIGDSVTEGTKNGGCPWYEPIEGYISNVRNCSWGGGTVQTLTENLEIINSEQSQLYVIAIGTNDVRYRDETKCAMTSQDYVSRIDGLCKGITNYEDAEFIFIAPWTSTDGDPFCDLAYDEKMELNSEFSAALEQYCIDNGHMYIDANPYINEYLEQYPHSEYLLDHIHPNFTNGLKLYSEAVMLSSN